ncbi:MAG: sigma-70 family RNA polymerase sigma factor [Alphaproteobacteria bacterium]|nr:sigma-70 family RNA polymerase sigma factor [Alphaproteobacteria bacterium]
MTHPDDDAALIDRVSRGDQAALAALYQRHAPLLLGAALRRLGDRSEAEDLVHDLFVEVWHKATTFDPARGSARTWLLVRLNSRAVDRLRAPRRARRAPAPPDPGQLVTTPSATSPDQLWVRGRMQALPERERAVLELAYFDGLSTREIASQQGIPVGTVKSRMAAGLKRLRVDAQGGPP